MSFKTYKRRFTFLGNFSHYRYYITTQKTQNPTFIKFISAALTNDNLSLSLLKISLFNFTISLFTLTTPGIQKLYYSRQIFTTKTCDKLYAGQFTG